MKSDNTNSSTTSEQVNTSETEEVNEWETCVVDPEYEINTLYPYEIRRKSNKRTISEGYTSYGYVQVTLNRKSFRKHRIVALQWIPNPDPDKLTDVDHIDRDRNNYHISNLRWVSSRVNNRNRSSTNGVIYEYINEIPDDSIKITDYGAHQFEDYYYYHDDETNKDFFYWYNGNEYRILHINVPKSGSLFVYMNDIDNKRVLLRLSKFKKLYGFI